MNNKNPSWWYIFALEYIRNGEKGSSAYRIAKPTVSFKTAEVESCKLLKNPKFSKVLDLEREKLNKAIDMSRDQWNAALTEIALSKPEKIDAGNKLRALELLGKAKGFLSNNLDVTSGGKSTSLNFVQSIAWLRENDTSPKLTEEDLKKVLEAEIIDD